MGVGGGELHGGYTATLDCPGKPDNDGGGKPDNDDPYSSSSPSPPVILLAEAEGRRRESRRGETAYIISPA